MVWKSKKGGLKLKTPGAEETVSNSRFVCAVIHTG